MDRRSRSPSPTPSSSSHAPLPPTRALNSAPRAGFRPLRMATTAPRQPPRENSVSALSPREGGATGSPIPRTNSPRLGTIQKIGRGKTMDTPPPRSPSRFASEARNSVYSIKAETDSTNSPKTPHAQFVDEPLGMHTDSPLASPILAANRISTTSNASAFASLSAALGLDIGGTPDASAASSRGRPPSKGSESGYSDVVIDDDDNVGVAIGSHAVDGDIPGSAQTATFPSTPAPPPIIGSPPSPSKSKKEARGPARMDSVNLGSEGAGMPPKVVDTPQFQAVDLDSKAKDMQPVDLDKTIEAGRVQSSDSWGISRQSTQSTMTTFSLGGKSVASSSAESTGTLCDPSFLATILIA